MMFFIILSIFRFLTILFPIKSMCGIIGVIGIDAVSKAFDGLKILEYRGYDSWGIAAPAGKDFFLERHTGKIGEAKLSQSPQSFFY